MNIEQILDPSLGELEFDRNSHLFKWSGALLYGNTYAVTTADQDTIEEMNITDWKYHPVRSTMPFPDRNRPDEEVSDLSAHEMRLRVFGNEGRIESDRTNRYGNNPPGFDPTLEPKTKPSFARPNLAAVFDQQQIEARSRIIENPFIKAWGIEAFSQNYYESPPLDQDAYLDGMQWVLHDLGFQILEFKMPRSTIKTLNASGTAQVFWLHASRKPHEHVEVLISQFCSASLDQMSRAATAKMGRIAQQCHRFAETGSLPVMDVNGSPDVLLCAANASTALVTIKLLRRLAAGIDSFRQGAELVCEEMRKGN